MLQNYLWLLVKPGVETNVIQHVCNATDKHLHTCPESYFVPHIKFKSSETVYKRRVCAESRARRWCGDGGILKLSTSSQSEGTGLFWVSGRRPSVAGLCPQLLLSWKTTSAPFSRPPRHCKRLPPVEEMKVLTFILKRLTGQTN